VLAREDCRLWRLHREVFRKRLQKSSSADLVRVLRNVDILSSLSMAETQQLVESLAQISYKAGDVIIQQGELSNAFYIIVSGEAAASIKYDVSSTTEVPAEVMRYKQYEYFGERALLLDAPRAATVKAVTDIELFYIRRDAFEMILGPLELIINHDRRRREKVAYLNQLQTEANSLLNSSLSSLYLWHPHSHDEVSSQHLCESYITGRIYTIRIWSKARIIEEMQQRRVINAQSISASMKSPPSVFLPQPICAFEDSRRLMSVYPSRVVCELRDIFEPGAPFNEDVTQFYCACVVLALDALQYEGIVLRTISVETMVLTAEGLLQCSDLRIAKNLAMTDTGRTYTLCGAPNYLAPEILLGQGYGHEADLWALGVMTYELLSGTMPFEGENELELYSRIRAHAGTSASPTGTNATAPPNGVTLSFPPMFSEEVCDLLDILLSRQPAKRHGGGGAGLEPLRQHLWFETMNWEALGNGELEGPHWAEMQQRLHDQHKKAAKADEGLLKRHVQSARVPEGESMAWCEDFEFLCRFYTCQTT